MLPELVVRVPPEIRRKLPGKVERSGQVRDKDQLSTSPLSLQQDELVLPK